MTFIIDISQFSADDIIGIDFSLIANPPGEVIKPGEFKKAFEMLDAGKPINYEGAAGSVDFDGNGDVITPIEIWRYKKGEIITESIQFIR